MEGQNKNILVFEGMFDYLSLLTLENQIEAHALILNSNSLVDRAMQYIIEEGLKAVELYLDNDQSGLNATQKVKDQLSNIDVKVIEQNEMYKQKFRILKDFQLNRL